MTCRELLRRFVEALERDEVDWEALRALRRKCGPSFALEAWKAFAEKLTRFAMLEAWSHYREAVLAGEYPPLAYAEAVYIVWGPWDGSVTPASFLPTPLLTRPRRRRNMNGPESGLS